MCLNLPQNIIRLAPENCQSSVHPVRQGAPGQTVYAALANNLRSSCNTQKFRLKYACPQTGLNDGERKFTAGTNKNECQLKGVSTHTYTHTRQARTLAIRRKREGFNEICTFPHLITKYVKQNHLVFAENSHVCVTVCIGVCVVARRHENKHMFTCKLHNNNAATPTPNKTQIIRCILLGCKSKLYGDFFLTVISAEKRVATATQPHSRQRAASLSSSFPSPLPLAYI